MARPTKYTEGADVEELDNQAINTHKILEDEKAKKVAPILPFMWKKGQSGNPAGRPKGKTMKEYAKELLACQTEEERQEFLHGLSKETIWKMAEGNPESKSDITSGGDKLETLMVKFIDDKDTGNTNGVS